MREFMTKIINKEKFFFSKEYNYSFNLETGYFRRWGKTLNDDPSYSPFGPEIADIEITTSCSGINNKLCNYCYKSNTPSGKNMSFETFKNIIDKINQNDQLTQVAFGLGSTGEENPDLWKMCEYLRNINIIPNGTVANVSDSTADKIAKYFGACAVSYHGNKKICYDSIKKLTDRGMKQVNIHYTLYQQNLNELYSVLIDIKFNKLLKGLNAIVLLALKNQGRAINLHYDNLSQKDFNDIILYCFENKISLGMDSCSGYKVLNFIKEYPKHKDIEEAIDPCESTLFSVYSNVDGEILPCSFCENKIDKINILQKNDFIQEVWNSDIFMNFRKHNLLNDRQCLVYNI